MADTHPAVREHLERIGRLGGLALSRKLSDEAKRESGRRAARARWAGHISKPRKRKRRSA